MIPFFDYRPLYRELKPEIDAAIARVLDSGRLILGPEVEALEAEIASRLGVAHAVGVGSGTDAIALALRALGIGAGDEVLTVANAGVPGVAAIRQAGATPRFVDVRPDTLLIDPNELEGALTARARAVLVTHLYGRAVPMAPIVELARSRKLRLIEDCAQALGATWQGHPVGGFGDVGCLSFYPTKNLGAFGDGGMCVTRDAEIARRVRALRMYGFAAGDRHAHVEGVNSRLDELQAAILRAKLRHLDHALARRRTLAAAYHEALRGSRCRLPEPDEGHAHHLFVVRVEERARAVAALDAAGIGYGIHYREGVHRMEAYRALGCEAGSLPATEHACARVLSLPLFPGLTDEQVQRVVGALRTVV